MFVIVTDPTNGKRLGLRSLGVQTGGIWSTFTVGTRLGIPGLRSNGPAYAERTRMLFEQVKQWAYVTGYRVEVETTRREAEALVRGGLVQSTVGTYRLRWDNEGSRMVTLYGHGK